jgi:drug/metabolite transporter (DMT)-like permease
MPVALVLFAASLHASWNALVKPAKDRLALMAVMGAASFAICVSLALFVQAPARAAWPEIALSALVHSAYNLLLIASYREGEFNQVYPVARGMSPPTVAVAAWLIVGETLSAVQVAGLVAVSGGLFAIAAGRSRGSRRALRFALLTGLAIAAYTVIDGIGVRRAGTPVGYIAWLFTLSGLMMPLALLVARSRTGRPVRIEPALLLRGVVAGTLSLVAYGLVLWAQTRAPLAIVAALRETSIVFAAGIGAVAFHERLPGRRLLASVVVAGGAVMLALG